MFQRLQRGSKMVVTNHTQRFLRELSDYFFSSRFFTPYSIFKFWMMMKFKMWKGPGKGEREGGMSHVQSEQP